jgi:hypothetical protein
MLREWIRTCNRADAASYRNLKLFIGVLGMALPVILVAGGLIYSGHTVQHSISHYYHTDLRDVMVGVLASASILFMSYAGYGIVDDILTWVVGVAGVGVILFPCPTYPEMPNAAVGVFRLAQSVSGPIHFSFAGAFFFFLALNSLFVFTMSDRDWSSMGPAKRARNLVYIICGAVILACLATLLVLWLAASRFFGSSSIALVFEALMLLAFGFAWLVKADIGLWRDPASAPQAAARNLARSARGPAARPAKAAKAAPRAAKVSRAPKPAKAANVPARGRARAPRGR